MRREAAIRPPVRKQSRLLRLHANIGYHSIIHPALIYKNGPTKQVLIMVRLDIDDPVNIMRQ